MHIMKIIAFILVLTGALNWGLVGLFGFDLVAAIFGSASILSRIIYFLVGLSALALIIYAREMFYCPKDNEKSYI